MMIGKAARHVAVPIIIFPDLNGTKL